MEVLSSGISERCEWNIDVLNIAVVDRDSKFSVICQYSKS